MLPAQRALLSVSNKDGLLELARGLERMGIQILSTGGTKRHLEESGVSVTSVSDVTGHPEILDGRVKTLHPAIHGGILADRGRAAHLSQLQEQGIQPIDLVVVNLYPFQETVETEDATYDQIVENIDIGGPCMLRAAAKNHSGVTVIVDPEDYPQVLAALEESDRVVPETLRKRLALKAFRHTQAYDTAISNWLERESGGEVERFPKHIHLDLTRELEPRYGENPHQGSAIYSTLGERGIFGGFEQLQGKELSWNNLLDADAARKLVSMFEAPAVVIVKHNNPCGVAIGETLVQAYERALECDPVSAFGSIVAINRQASGELADAMADLFVEVMVAPDYEQAALDRYGRKKNLRVLRCPVYAPHEREIELRAIAGGFLAQVPDAERDDPSAWECPTRLQPSDEMLRGLEFVWKVSRHVKSNAIIVGNRHQTVGIGAGQMSRIDSCRLAIEKAQLPVEGCYAASDAFFPFRDGIEQLCKAGISAIAQPGGSKRDNEVVEAADEYGIVMVMTGRRHFKH